jgi:hypothetical protein
VALLHCAKSPAVSLEPPTPPGECILLRDNASGVLAMDVGGSIELGNGASLFIFGDTFFGTWNHNGSRGVAGAVHSSAAVVNDTDVGTCFSGATFVFDAGGIEQILDPTQDQSWPLGPMLLEGGSLALLYTWVRSASSAGLGFDTLGNGLAAGSVDGPIPVDVVRLSAPSSQAMPAAWLIVDGYAYLYRCGSQLDAGWDPCIVGRASLSELSSLPTYRYFVVDAGYVGSYAQASVVVQGAPAFSVTYNTYLRAFLELYVEPLSSWVSVRTAAAPEGPFSDKIDVWQCSLPADDSRSYCYAAFEHPQLDLAQGRRVAFSYSTNTTDFGSMLRHPNLGWPRLASVDLADAGL